MSEQPTLLYLVRHGETHANAGNIICGGTESPLTENGVRQARELAETLRGVAFDAVYTSALSRAVDTASSILEGRDLVPTVLPDLGEQQFGEWEGLPFKEVAERDPEAVRVFSEDPYRAVAPGGESMPEFIERVRRAFYDRILANGAGGRVLCVCHGGTIRAALNILLDLDAEKHFYRFAVHNATVNVVRWRKEYPRLLGMGLRDAAHLNF